MRQILRSNWCSLFQNKKIVYSLRYLNYDCFADRHIGPTELEKQQMLFYLGFKVNLCIYVGKKIYI